MSKQHEITANGIEYTYWYCPARSIGCLAACWAWSCNGYWMGPNTQPTKELALVAIGQHSANAVKSSA